MAPPLRLDGCLECEEMEARIDTLVTAMHALSTQCFEAATSAARGGSGLRLPLKLSGNHLRYAQVSTALTTTRELLAIHRSLAHQHA